MGTFIQNDKLYNMFYYDGSVLESKCHGPSAVRFLENIDAVRVALQGRLQDN
jgi:hypothetical protein